MHSKAATPPATRPPRPKDAASPRPQTVADTAKALISISKSPAAKAPLPIDEESDAFRPQAWYHWYVLRPHSRRMVAWELLGLIIMLLHGLSNVMWFAEHNAQAVNHRDCLENTKPFANLEKIKAAELLGPPLFPNWLVAADAGGDEEVPMDVLTGFWHAHDHNIELPLATTMTGVVQNLVHKQLNKSRRGKCQHLKPNAPRRDASDTAPYCYRFCSICDALRILLDVYDFFHFLLIFITAFQLPSGRFESRLTAIARHRLTSPYLPAQMLVATPTYLIVLLTASEGRKTAAAASKGGPIIALVRSRLLHHGRMHLEQQIKENKFYIAAGAAIYQEDALRAIKMLRLAVWIIKRSLLVLRHVNALMRVSHMLRQARSAMQRVRERMALSTRVQKKWKRIRIAHADALGLAARLGGAHNSAFDLLQLAADKCQSIASQVGRVSRASVAEFGASMRRRSMAAARGVRRRSIAAAQATLGISVLEDSESRMAEVPLWRAVRQEHQESKARPVDSPSTRR